MKMAKLVSRIEHFGKLNIFCWLIQLFRHERDAHGSGQEKCEGEDSCAHSKPGDRTSRKVVQTRVQTLFKKSSGVIFQAFLVLKQHLPSLRQFTKRVSKLRILNAAINYIDTLLKLIQTTETVPASVINATLGPVVPTPVRASQKMKQPDPSQQSSIHSRPLILPRQQNSLLSAGPLATCAPDHSLVDYRSSLASSFQSVQPVHMPSVFSPPQPTFPYMKTLLDYPTYFYQPSTAPPPPPPPHSQPTPSHLIVNNPLVPMPSYQCF